MSGQTEFKSVHVYYSHNQQGCIRIVIEWEWPHPTQLSYSRYNNLTYAFTSCLMCEIVVATVQVVKIVEIANIYQREGSR